MTMWVLLRDWNDERCCDFAQHKVGCNPQSRMHGVCVKDAISQCTENRKMGDSPTFHFCYRIRRDIRNWRSSFLALSHTTLPLKIDGSCPRSRIDSECDCNVATQRDIGMRRGKSAERRRRTHKLICRVDPAH